MVYSDGQNEKNKVFLINIAYKSVLLETPNTSLTFENVLNMSPLTPSV